MTPEENQRRVADAMSDSVLRVTIPIEPKPKGRPRAGRGRVYTDDQTKAYEAAVGLFARQKVTRRNDADDLAVSADFYLPNRQRKDIDNLLKALLDGLNGVAWRDDAQVVEVHSRIIRDGSSPRTEVYVAIAEGATSLPAGT